MQQRDESRPRRNDGGDEEPRRARTVAPPLRGRRDGCAGAHSGSTSSRLSCSLSPFPTRAITSRTTRRARSGSNGLTMYPTAPSSLARALSSARGARGEEDDRDVARRRVRRELRGDLPAVELGHHHVEEDELRRRRPNGADGLATVCRLDDGQTVALEIDAADRADRSFVIDEQDTRRGLGPGAATDSATGLGKTVNATAPVSARETLRLPVGARRPKGVRSTRPAPLPGPHGTPRNRIDDTRILPQNASVALRARRSTPRRARGDQGR